MIDIFKKGNADTEFVKRFNEAVLSLVAIEQKDDGFSRAVFIHQLLNKVLDNDTLKKLTDEINEWVNAYHRD